MELVKLVMPPCPEAGPRVKAPEGAPASSPFRGGQGARIFYVPSGGDTGGRNALQLLSSLADHGLP